MFHDESVSSPQNPPIQYGRDIGRAVDDGSRGRDREPYLHGAPLLLALGPGRVSGRSLGTEELARLRAVIESGTLTATKGVQTPELEQRARELTGALPRDRVQLGERGVHAAVAALDPEPGDEIVTTAITDMGALAPLLAPGRDPASSPTSTRSTGMVTAATVEAALSARTRAVVVTHLFGLPAPNRRDRRPGRRRGIPVVEDCAQAYLHPARRAAGRLLRSDRVLLDPAGQAHHHRRGRARAHRRGRAGAPGTRMFVNKAWPYGEADPDHEFLAPELPHDRAAVRGRERVSSTSSMPGWPGAERRSRASPPRSSVCPASPLPSVASDDVATYWKVPLLVDASRAGRTAGGRRRARRSRCRRARRATSRSRRSRAGCSPSRGRSARAAGRSRSRARRRSTTRGNASPARTSYLDRVLVLPWNERYEDGHADAVAERARCSRATELGAAA